MVGMNNQSQLLVDSRRCYVGWPPVLAAPETAIGRYPNHQPAAKQWRWKRRKESDYPRRFHNKTGPGNGGRFAPRNTTSFLMRAKRAGGIAPLVSPAALPARTMWPAAPELPVDATAEQLGVDSYGTMKGLIRLKPREPVPRLRDDGDGSGESGVEVERRLGQDVGRFEMVCLPDEQTNALGYRVDDQELHIARLEEENLTLRDRVLVMEGEMAEVRRRLQMLEEERAGEDGEVVEGEVWDD